MSGGILEVNSRGQQTIRSGAAPLKSAAFVRDQSAGARVGWSQVVLAMG